MQYITKKVYNSIINTIGKYSKNSSFEAGGILGEKNGVLCEYYFDKTAKCTKDEYTPNIKKLNRVIKKWQRKGVIFAGIVHSHPNMYDKPSLNDEEYARNLLLINPELQRLIFPIVTTSSTNIQLSFYEYKKTFIEIDISIIGAK